MPFAPSSALYLLALQPKRVCGTEVQPPVPAGLMRSVSVVSRTLHCLRHPSSILASLVYLGPGRTGSHLSKFGLVEGVLEYLEFTSGKRGLHPSHNGRKPTVSRSKNNSLTKSC